MSFKKLQNYGYNLAFNSINKNLEPTLFVRRVEFSSISNVRYSWIRCGFSKVYFSTWAIFFKLNSTFE